MVSQSFLSCPQLLGVGRQKVGCRPSLWQIDTLSVATQDLVYRVCFCYHHVARTILYSRTPDMSILLTILHNHSSSLPCMLKVLKVGGLDSLVRHAAFFFAWSPHVSPVIWMDVPLIPRILRSLTLM